MMMPMRYALSLPERLLRALAALLGGAAQETAQLVLPRVVRRSRFYEATAKNLLRITVELVGGVEAKEPAALPAGKLAVRKGAGNVVELGSIAAFGFSPLWLLAGASDLLRGSRVYLAALVEELKRAGVLADEAEVGSVDELLGVLERGAGRTAALVDVPPVELAELRRSLAELAAEREALPSQAELAAVYEGLRRTAERERRPLLEVSAGVGLAFLVCAGRLTREHLVVPYREDWRPVRREGFAAYAERVAAPYRRAVEAHLERGRPTLTERALRSFRRKGGAAMSEVLDRSGVSYERLPHSHTESAVDEAEALGLPPDEVAKTVVVKTASGNLRAVVPASCRIDLRKLRAIVGGSKKTLHLLSEDELAEAYGEFELGAVPPFGGPEGDRVIVDRRVAELESVVIEAGSHDESVRLKTGDLVGLTKADIADVCVD
jgi:prolyl-tRNA editing enzyme YbaK/EbsC (Cys-tRNA(Pro) deacylase)